MQPGAKSLIKVPVAFGDAEFSTFKATVALECLTNLPDNTETAGLRIISGFDHLLRT